jgi:DNA-binding CsgD family transcriptional regulator
MRGQAQKYPVVLSEVDKAYLEGVCKRGEHSRRERERAQILLWSAAGKTDVEIAGLLSVTPYTVAMTRERWAKERRLADLPKAGRKRKLDGVQEAVVVALACSEAPEGREHWTLKLLADKLVELAVVESIAPETVRVTLKKTPSSPGKTSSGASRR